MNSERSNNLNLKYKSCTRSSCQDKEIVKFEFVAKTQCLCYSQILIVKDCLLHVFYDNKVFKFKLFKMLRSHILKN